VHAEALVLTGPEREVVLHRPVDVELLRVLVAGLVTVGGAGEDADRGALRDRASVDLRVDRGDPADLVTDVSQRSVSSITAGSSVGSATTRRSTSGWVSSAVNALPMTRKVVSAPAGRRRRRNP